MRGLSFLVRFLSNKSCCSRLRLRRLSIMPSTLYRDDGDDSEDDADDDDDSDGMMMIDVQML